MVMAVMALASKVKAEAVKVVEAGDQAQAVAAMEAQATERQGEAGGAVAALGSEGTRAAGWTDHRRKRISYWFDRSRKAQSQPLKTARVPRSQCAALKLCPD